MSFEGKVQSVANELAEHVYGYASGTFRDGIEVTNVSDVCLSNGLPLIERQGQSTKLVLPQSGAEVWRETIGDTCDQIDIDPDKIYIAAGISLLELANVASYAVGHNDIVPRLRKIQKVFSDDKPIVQISNQYSERTSIDFTTIVRDLDPEDVLQVQKLRYGIGVALKAYAPDSQLRADFINGCSSSASNEIVNYVKGVSSFLDRILVIENLPKATGMTPEKITADITYKKFPFIAIAASQPMRVDYLLNRSE